jgi:chromosomal replication initiator protein
LLTATWGQPFFYRFLLRVGDFAQFKRDFLEHLWNSVKELLSTRLDTEGFQLWLEPLKEQDSSSSQLVLTCPNAYHLRMVKEKYLQDMQVALSDVGETRPICLRANSNPAVDKAKPGYKQMKLPHIGSGMPLLNQSFVFDRFVSGGGNELACAAAKAMARGQRLFSNTLFLVSGTGLGKSHLTQAVGHQVLHNSPQARVAYLTTEDFTNQMVSAIRRKKINSFKERYRRDCDVLLLEEVSFLTGKDKIQDELTYTLDALMDAGKKVILTCCCPPTQVKGLKRNLASRFSGGVTVTIDPPDHDTRVRILKNRAQEEGVAVDVDVLEYLAQEVTSDVRRLQSALVGLLAKGSLTSRTMDLNLAAEVIGQMKVNQSRITPERIRKEVAHAYGMEVAVLTGKSRRKAVTKPRNLAMFLCRRHTDASYAAIGNLFNRDHATVMYGVNKIDTDLSRDPKLVQEVAYLEQRLGTNTP